MSEKDELNRELLRNRLQREEEDENLRKSMKKRTSPITDVEMG